MYNKVDADVIAELRQIMGGWAGSAGPRRDGAVQPRRSGGPCAPIPRCGQAHHAQQVVGHLQAGSAQTDTVTPRGAGMGAERRGRARLRRHRPVAGKDEPHPGD